MATIAMDDPARRNALGHRMLPQLTEAFRAVTEDGARAVVLRAAPGNAVWCAGFDIDNLHPGHDPLADGTPLKTLFDAIRDCPAPVVAMLHGTAWGGGADLALRCDIAVADPTCTLAFTPARLGLPYDTDGLLNVLLRAGLPLATEMFATATPVPADRALAAGLLNHLVTEEGLEPFTAALAARIAANAPLSVASAKGQLRALNAALRLSPEALQAVTAARHAALNSADFTEGLAAFREKRRPTFRGA